MDQRLGPEAGEPHSGLPAHAQRYAAAVDQRSVGRSQGFLTLGPDIASLTPKSAFNISKASMDSSHFLVMSSTPGDVSVDFGYVTS